MRVAVTGLLVVVLATSGCAGVDQADDDHAITAADESAVYECQGVAATLDDLATARTLDEIQGHPAEDVVASSLSGPRSEWVALVATEDRIAAIRNARDVASGAPLEVLEVVSTAAEGVGDFPPWQVDALGPCDLRLQSPGGLGPVEIELADIPGADDTSVRLRVRGQGCSDGTTDTDRIEVVRTEVTADHVGLLLGMRASETETFVTCPGNASVVIDVPLPEPLGQREVLDLSRFPPKQLAAPPG